MRATFGPWPGSRAEAARLGASDFFTGVACSNGHIAIRRTKSARCFECDKLRWERVRRRKGKQPFKPNNAQRAAVLLGQRYFNGTACRHGHAGKRWTHNGACVECTMAASREYKRKPQGVISIREYRAKNKAKIGANNRNAKARRKGATGRHTAKDIADILRLQRYRCAYCGTSVRNRASRHVDHIMPLARGGTNDRANIQVTCPPCNLEKWASDPLDFARKKGMLL